MENQTFKFDTETITIPGDWEVIEPMRCFDYESNRGAWIVARTQFREEDNCRMLYLRLDIGGYAIRDPQDIADWDI
jgi:hypothetical protein